MPLTATVSVTRSVNALYCMNHRANHPSRSLLSPHAGHRRGRPQLPPNTECGVGEGEVEMVMEPTLARLRDQTITRGRVIAVWCLVFLALLLRSSFHPLAPSCRRDGVGCQKHDRQMSHQVGSLRSCCCSHRHRHRVVEGSVRNPAAKPITIRKSV